MGRGSSSLGYFALYPWVVVGVSLDTSCLLLACLLFAPCLPRRGTPCLYGEVAFPRVAAWSLYRVGSLLGAASLWSSLVGTVIHSSSQGKSPGAAHMSAPGCLVIVVQYVKPVGCLCLSTCRDAARHVSTGWGIFLFLACSLLAETQECVSTGWGFFFLVCLQVVETWRAASPQLAGVSKNGDYNITLWVRLAQERILMVTAK